jgi:hypothetical protein
MLLEVIQTRPSLVGAGAVLSEAEIHHLGTSLGFFIMNAFLVAGEVVDGAEALFPGTVRLVAFEGLPVACFVFPAQVLALALFRP